VKNSLINGLSVFLLISCSSIDNPVDSKRNWAYLTNVPIYEMSESSLGEMAIIDTSENEITTYNGGENHDLFDSGIHSVFFYHLENFRFALLGEADIKIAYPRGLNSSERLLIEHDIRGNESIEHQYSNIFLHKMDVFNQIQMNFIGWNLKRDSVFQLVVDKNFNEVARFYVPIVFSTYPITVQTFAVSESGRYLVVAYYDYPNTGGIKEYLDIFERQNGKFVKLFDLPKKSNELVRDFMFSKDERFLIMLDINGGRIYQSDLGQPSGANIVYDPLADFNKFQVTPHVLRIPNEGNDFLIREIYDIIDEEMKKEFDQEIMELKRYNPELGLLNSYKLDNIKKGNFVQGGFPNDSTYIAFEWHGGKNYTNHEYRFDVQNGFELKKSKSYKSKDENLNTFSYLVFDGHGRW
jgi:hypothetical protein